MARITPNTGDVWRHNPNGATYLYLTGDIINLCVLVDVGAYPKRCLGKQYPFGDIDDTAFTYVCNIFNLEEEK
jgi:hypothetical protein